MSGSDQRGRITHNTSNINLFLQNTAQDGSYNAWGVLAGPATNQIITDKVTAETEILSTTDEDEHPNSHLTYSEETTLFESRRQCVIEDDEKRSPEEISSKQLAGAAADNSEEEEKHSLDNYIAMPPFQSSSSEHQDHPDSFETVEFGRTGPPKYKRQTDADYFHCGRLIGVPSNDQNQLLRGRTLLVLTVSNHGWAQCVCLCRHEGLNGLERRPFYRAHGAIYSKDSSSVRQLSRTEHDPINAKMSNVEYKIREDCYINFEHTFTLNKDFTVASLGTVEDKQRLVEMYQKVQNSMYERQIKAIIAGED